MTLISCFRCLYKAGFRWASGCPRAPEKPLSFPKRSTTSRMPRMSQLCMWVCVPVCVSTAILSTRKECAELCDCLLVLSASLSAGKDLLIAKCNLTNSSIPVCLMASHDFPHHTLTDPSVSHILLPIPAHAYPYPPISQLMTTPISAHKGPYRPILLVPFVSHLEFSGWECSSRSHISLLSLAYKGPMGPSIVPIPSNAASHNPGT